MMEYDPELIEAIADAIDRVPEDYERVTQILAASRRPYHPSELPPHLKAAVKDARMGAEHTHLNALLDENYLAGGR